MTMRAVRRVATYQRVSSEDQRERETIKTQGEALDRQLAADADVLVVERYVDDGVSGTIPMEQRSAGKRLLAAARAGQFDELWVFKLDRLGRDEIDLLTLRRQLTRCGVVLRSLQDNATSDLEYNLRAVIAAEERKGFLARSAAGMARAARDGRYCGGIVPLGYRVDGKKPHVYLLPSDVPMWADLSEADVVRRIYRRLADDGWSCRRIADELNALQVPTAYQRAGRGVRGQRTQGLWRPGRIRNLVVNPVYRGEYQYGRRSTTPGGREIITATVPALVASETWALAQATLAGYRIMAKGPRRSYLLRGLIRCGVCGLHYCGTANKASIWYRCDGQLVERGPLPGRCPGKSIKGDVVDALVWADVARFLRDPGALLDELAEEATDADGSRRVLAEAEHVTLRALLTDLAQQQDRATQLYIRGRLTAAELDEQLGRIAAERAEVERRLAALAPLLDEPAVVEPSVDLLDELRQRLDTGLSEEQRAEIVRLLVRRITVYTEERAGTQKEVRIVVEYRFPSVGLTCTGTGSSRRSARSSPGTARCPARARS